MVGTGALGCEYIKMFALMGLGCSKDGCLYTTDDDCIETSNLNRQFLFRNDDVKKSKSIVAGLAGQEMNSDLNVKSFKLRVAPGPNEKVFDETFWSSLDGVANALDNIKARKYVDSKCVFHNKCLFESGTLGTKCNSQVIIPFKTQSYSDSADPPEKGIPLCTLKNFPYLLDHCIQWARNHFEGVFAAGPAECNQFLTKGKSYLDEIENENENQYDLRNKLSAIVGTLKCLQNANTKQCVEMARKMFTDVHHHMIANLLHNFPVDHVNDRGLKFWTSPKRPPQTIPFDVNDEMCCNFVYAAANIFAFTLNLPEIDRATCLKIAVETKVAVWKPRKMTIKENEEDDATEGAEDDEEIIKKDLAYLRGLEISPAWKVNLTEFEKDDDTNHHIDFIAACSNLRARNYKITEGSRHEVKMIAGKIIPAIATATALIVGLNGMEIIKEINGIAGDQRRNTFVNLALPLWIFSEPLPPLFIEDKDYDVMVLGPVKAIPGSNPPFSSQPPLLQPRILVLGQALHEGTQDNRSDH